MVNYFIWSLVNLVRIIREWQSNEFDGIIIIDGNRGIGKSNLACLIGFRCKFKPKKDIVFSRDDVINAMKQKHKIIVADEMINVTHNRDFFVSQQKKLIKILNMYRDNCNILICCVPNFWDLDNQIRNLCKMRINVVRRGLAVIHTKNQTSFSTDKWDRSYNEKIEKGWIKENGNFNPKYQKLSTFRGFIKFGKLKAKQDRIYRELKELKRNVVFEQDPNEKRQGSFYDVLYNKVISKEIDDDKLKVICEVSGKRYSTVRNMLTSRLRDDNHETPLTVLLGRDKRFKASKSLKVPIKFPKPPE